MGNRKRARSHGVPQHVMDRQPSKVFPQIVFAWSLAVCTCMNVCTSCAWFSARKSNHRIIDWSMLAKPFQHVSALLVSCWSSNKRSNKCHGRWFGYAGCPTGSSEGTKSHLDVFCPSVYNLHHAAQKTCTYIEKNTCIDHAIKQWATYAKKGLCIQVSQNKGICGCCDPGLPLEKLWKLYPGLVDFFHMAPV